AALAAHAPGGVEVHDPVRAAVERHRRADGDTRRRVAVVAAEHREVAPGLREGPALDVFHPRAERAERDAVLLLARHRAGVAADAAALIDHEAVAHASAPPARHPARHVPPDPQRGHHDRDRERLLEVPATEATAHHRT